MLFIPSDSHGINLSMVKIDRLFSVLQVSELRAQFPVHFRFLPSIDEK